MMEAYRTPSKESQEFILANVTYEAVIDGLNGYFASEPKNDYITVKMTSDKQNFALYEAEAWADILISWLRTEHGIFYYPGMETRYAKMEKIPPFTKRMMNEGALNSLKKLYKNVTGEEDETSSHTLIASTISCNFSNKDRMISVLKEQNELLKDEVRQLNRDCYRESYISDRIHEICTAKGVELDDAFLYGDDYTWEDLVGFLCEEIRKLKTEIGSKESGIEDLKEHITLLEADLKKAKMEKEKFLIEVADREEEIESLQNKDYDVYLEHRQYIIKGIMCNIRQDASRNGFALPEKVDGEPLSIERTFHDLIELLMKRTAEVKEARKKHWNDLRDIHKALGRDGTCDSIDGFAKAVKARAEYVESLSRNAERETQKSDTNKLIREYCTKHDIVAPSRYLSDEACIEYLFSVVDLERKHRAAVGKQMVDDYEKDLLKFIYKAYKDRTHLNDETITYNPPSVRNTITKIISGYARSRTRVDILEGRIKSIFDKYKTKFTVDDHVINGDPTTSFMLDCISSWICSPAESRGKTRAEIENYKLKLKDYILKDIEEHGYRYDGLQTKSIEDIVGWIITMATCNRSNIALRDIYTTVASPAERLRYNIDDCDGATASHMKDYILRRFEGLRINTEYCLKKMSELDGCQKDLKILEEQREDLLKQNAVLANKIDAKDGEISRLKDLIKAMNGEVGDM